MLQIVGTSDHLLEDLPTLQEHQFILQARQFLKSGNHPILYIEAVEKSLPLVGGVQSQTAMELLAEIEMLFINRISAEFKKSSEDRRGGDTKATKPADLYRKYAKALRVVSARDGDTGMLAQSLLSDLFLEQTLSTGDLENPEYLDPYTGEAIYDDVNAFAKALPEVHEPGLDELLKFIAMAPDEEADTFTGTAPIIPGNQWEKEIRLAAERCKAELNWGDEEVAAFIKANMDGVSMPELEAEHEDDRGYVPPTLTKDFELDGVILADSWAIIRSFNECRSAVFQFMGQRVVKIQNGKASFQPRVRGNWHAEFRNRFTASDEFQAMIAAIALAAQSSPETAAVLYLRVSGEYGVMHTDIEHIKINHPSGTLLDFVVEFFDDMMELMRDGGLFPTSEIASYAKIETADAEFMNDLTGMMPEFDPNPVKTASWNIAFIQAVAAGGEWREAEDAAWAAWRMAMDDKAAAVYTETYNRTQNRKAAMAAFWRACKKSVPRPQEKIKAIHGKTGLTLEGGRVIDWRIAKLKIANNELDLSGDIKPRLAARLTELGVGSEILPLLQ